MLNKNALNYFDYNFGDRVDDNYLYGGIYKKNILLINLNSRDIKYNYDVKYIYTYYKVKLNFKNVPTFNELNYLINIAYKNAISISHLVLNKITINEFLNVDNIYYMPNIVHYVLYIKRIPIE
jgi:hypothetical protein